MKPGFDQNSYLAPQVEPEHKFELTAGAPAAKSASITESSERGALALILLLYVSIVKL